MDIFTPPFVINSVQMYKCVYGRVTRVAASVRADHLKGDWVNPRHVTGLDRSFHDSWIAAKCVFFTCNIDPFSTHWVEVSLNGWQEEPHKVKLPLVSVNGDFIGPFESRKLAQWMDLFFLNCSWRRADALIRGKLPAWTEISQVPQWLTSEQYKNF